MEAWEVRPFSAVETGEQLSRPGAAPRLQLYDTASRRLVPAGPSTGTARMYVCGITPYDATHLGHANTYVAFDLLHRTWRDAGLAVDYVQNVTDVDDPLLERAAKTGVDWQHLAADQTDLYRGDMAALNVLPPRELVGAVEAIPVINDAITRLHDRAAVYAVDDPAFPDLYFATASDAEFGSLSHLSEPDALALFAERGGDPDRIGKKNQLDCLVWRRERAHEPAWDSPFGPGRPGWHIECTAIALRLLGADFDVQGGGSDLIFPHHEMSAAHGRVITDRPFAKVFAHSGMVGLGGEKMSKSRGNLVLVSRLRASDIDPMAIRLVLLAHHYRDDWTYTDDQLTEARGRLERWRAAVQLDAALEADQTVAAIRSALAHDLDGPAALAAVDAWASASLAIDGDDTYAPGLVARACDALLGVTLLPLPDRRAA